MKFRPPSNSRFKAFTLLEIMVATAIFFMAAFAILQVVSLHLRSVRLMQIKRPSAGMLAAELSLTNRLEEGTEIGDFGDLYPEYTWQRDIMFYATNGLFQVTYTIFKEGAEAPDSTMDLLLFRPDSAQFSRTRR